jgi:3-hydroxybutyryl-CoA dehydrogenase
VASTANIDAAVKEGIGLRWALLGPLEIMDVGGLDVFNTIGGYLFPELHHETEGSKLLDELVARGIFGAKSGAGFYE